ncbi:MAG TPA: glycosyltransferase [Candidatus Binataceae bacterium]|nr:glycosyltransferase [Candidatus Binataceae bacterium]
MPQDGLSPGERAATLDLSVILPVLNEADNLRQLLPKLSQALEHNGLRYEIMLIDGGSRDDTAAVAAQAGARLLPEQRPGYGGALVTGFKAARGQYLLTLDADMSHEPTMVGRLWQARHLGDIVIASRYVRGGLAYTSWGRRALSQLLNRVLRRLLSMPVRDLSSGFRLYHRDAVAELSLQGRNFEVLEEILIKAYAAGFSIGEVPFTYFPRDRGVSHARLLRFGLDLSVSALKLWKLRNSIESADYDARAFYSPIPLQRYWQRRRHQIITGWARAAGRTLDAGAGSSMIIQSLSNAIAMEYNFSKTRYLKRLGIPVTRGSAFALPFRSGCFDCVISSQVIEHIPFDETLFDEMVRVLRPGGQLIVGTPDYATIGWRMIEPIYGALMPGGYRDEHISHYTRQSLAQLLERRGLVHEATAYVARSELIMRYRKPTLALKPVANEAAVASASTSPAFDAAG